MSIVMMAQAGQMTSLFVAGSAGALSFASPCVLPLVPGYLSFVSGITLDDADGVSHARRRMLKSALLFCLGFSAVFVALGAAASGVGQLLFQWRDWIARIGGILLVLFGVHMMGMLNWSVLGRDTRVYVRERPVGAVGSVVVGMAFAAGWSPCLGPILGSILTYAAATATVGRGVALLAAYSMGLSIPFLLAAAATTRLLAVLRARRGVLNALTRVFGLLLVVVGVLLVTGSLARLASVLQAATPVVLRLRL